MLFDGSFDAARALDMARRGDADVVFVHDQMAEEKFVADGFGLKRQSVMYKLGRAHV